MKPVQLSSAVFIEPEKANRLSVTLSADDKIDTAEETVPTYFTRRMY